MRLLMVAVQVLLLSILAHNTKKEPMAPFLFVGLLRIMLVLVRWQLLAEVARQPWLRL